MHSQQRFTLCLYFHASYINIISHEVSRFTGCYISKFCYNRFSKISYNDSVVEEAEHQFKYLLTVGWQCRKLCIQLWTCIFNNNTIEKVASVDTRQPSYGNALFSPSPSPSVCILAVTWARSATTPRSLYCDRTSMVSHVWCHCCQCPSGGL